MDVVCAWCGLTYATRDEPESDFAAVPTDEVTVSHGICEQCHRLMDADVSTPLESFIDSIDMPIVVLDADYVACTANRLACDELGIDRTVVAGQRGGELFGCVQANRPGGCGCQTSCTTCSIRQAVRHTAATGQSRCFETQYPDLGDGETRGSVRIHTVAREGLIFLQIQPQLPPPAIPPAKI